MSNVVAIRAAELADRRKSRFGREFVVAELETVEQCDQAEEEISAEISSIRAPVEVWETGSATDMHDETRDWLIRARGALNHRYRIRHLIAKHRTALRRAVEKQEKAARKAAHQAEMQGVPAEVAAALIEKQRIKTENIHRQEAIWAATSAAKAERIRLSKESTERQERTFIGIVRERLGEAETLAIWDEVRRRLGDPA